MFQFPSKKLVSIQRAEYKAHPDRVQRQAVQRVAMRSEEGIRGMERLLGKNLHIFL
ncbi:hypothetical protein [Anatilimnocola aggregata]|uniref:hypothetical protein n=1 Tax=Anatilimnocola aggregata TaxID=2528021 RepID=UPI00192E63B6|nr:hypothetical protein [Anatilimnocola aggregata]